ncbi:MAG: heavy-metal-associated domain-containing protein [Alphaproteobacteria bacterium]|nr:MAG: heavy-metal-associated domain-containing protein [Alphaproteobacteria bacterium]
MTFARRPLAFVIPAVAALLVGAGMLYAQLEGSERGIPPVDSTSNFEIMGVDVDVSAENAEKARIEGWRRAQSLGWRMLWARTHRRPLSEAPVLTDSVLNNIVSGIIIEQEQIGPNRYIARLGVQFDRARTGQMLGVQGLARRSAPMLVIPVMVTGSSAYSFEFRNEWQRAWAQFRTAGSAIDYVRPSGAGVDPLVLNMGQTKRRGRGWWRMLLDQYGAADIVVPEVDLRRAYPGGPAMGVFSARYGPDNVLIGRFTLTARNSAEIPQMLAEGVRRLDILYTQALDSGLLRPDPSLVILQPPLPPLPVEETEQVAEDMGQQVPAGQTTTFNIQVPTPDAAAVQQAEISVSRVNGVTSAITTSLALGGSSTMRVTFVGDSAALQAALQAQGWQVQASGNSLRISR